LFFKGRDLLSLADLSDAEMTEIISFAREMKARFHAGESIDFLSGAHLFVMDPEGLLGAWNPLALAMTQLGGFATVLDLGDLRERWGETWLDRARLMELSGHGLAAAGLGEPWGQAFLEELASEIHVPVINALSDLAAPMQALASLLSLTERMKGELEDSRAALLWAPPGHAQKPVSLPLSLAESILRRGIPLRMAGPARFRPGEGIHSYLDAFLPGGLDFVEDPAEAVEGADIVYSMNWTLQDEPIDLEKLADMGRDYAAWKMSPELFGLASDRALLGGGLPQSRDNEIAAELLESERSIHLEESANLLHVAKAVLTLFLDPAIAGGSREDHDTTVQ